VLIGEGICKSYWLHEGVKRDWRVWKVEYDFKRVSGAEMIASHMKL
jgi:hypothetical protein